MKRFPRRRIITTNNCQENGSGSWSHTKMSLWISRGGNRIFLGLHKNYYRCLPIKEKNIKETFKQSIRKSICSKKILTIHRVRAFSRWARQYTLAYYTMLCQQHGIQDVTTNETSNLTTVKIEHIVKQFKTHRCAIDFDSSFIKSVTVKHEEE